MFGLSIILFLVLIGKRLNIVLGTLLKKLFYKKKVKEVVDFGIKKNIMKKKKGIIVSGYFNPLHKGHLEYINKAKLLADELIVIVNNDNQRALKESKEFQLEDERMLIVSNLKAVNKAVLAVDSDRSVCKTLEKISKEFGVQYDFFFANGGDKTNELIPEISVCKKMGITLIDGLGDKIQSSSWLLNK